MRIGFSAVLYAVSFCMGAAIVEPSVSFANDSEKIVGLNSEEIPVFKNGDLIELLRYLNVDDFSEINILEVDGYAVHFEWDGGTYWTVKGFFVFEGGHKNCLERTDNRAGSRGLSSGC